MLRSVSPSSANGLILLIACAGSIATIIAVVIVPIIGLLLILGVAAALVAARAPGVLFAAYLLIPFYKGAVQPYSPVDLTVVLALMNALQVIPVILDRQPRELSRAGIVLWTALAFLVLGGVLYAPDQSLALTNAISFWALVFIPITAAALRVGSDERYLRQFLWTFFVVGAVVVLLGLTQLSGTRRLVVLEANTINVAKAALVVPLVGLAFVLHERRRLLQIAVIGLAPAAVVIAVASGSRGPLLMLAILGGLVAIRSIMRPRAVDWRTAGGAIGVILATVVLMSMVATQLPNLSIDRFALLGDFVDSGLSGDLNSSSGDVSAATRVTLFGLAASLLADHPILGVGTAGFGSLSPHFLGPTEAHTYPHNAFLQFGAEFGLAGLALFVCLVVHAVSRPLPRGEPWRAVRILFLFFLLNAMVSGDIFADRETWGLLMVVLLVDRARVGRGRPDGS